MIRIILRGRTGNILFQYALGRVLAAKHRVPLILGAHWYNSAGWAEVSHFLNLPIRAKVARAGSLGSIASRTIRKLTGKHHWEYLHAPVLRENPQDQSFDPRFPAAPSDCVLIGYFQSPRYFGNLADDIRSEIHGLIARGAGAFLPNLIKQEIARPDSVAVHIRRGDFLQLPVFQVCDESYYRQSMEELRAQVPGARFFIFSDDPSWCRANFTDPDTRVVDDRLTDNPLHDLHLMSLASHHIISNSSYSWWAAWLADKPGQQVIMPGRWYAKDILAPMEEKRWQSLDLRERHNSHDGK